MMHLKGYVSSQKLQKAFHPMGVIHPTQISTSPYHMTLQPEITYQTHLGFGGAFTESAAYVWSKLSHTKQQLIIDLYFSKDGLRYNMGRTHINSCDFSLENYTYVQEGDVTLDSFDLSREDLWVVPMMREALKREPHLKLLASPWSPPGWMKTNNQMNFGGKLKPEYQHIWARYYVKYIMEMKKRGIPYWAISVQNEPAATQTWDSCIYSAEEERDFIKNALGPIVHAYDPQINILGWDHNRDIIVERAKPLLEDFECAKHLYGIANHWYVSEAFENVGKVKSLFPDTHLIFTEGCIEGGPKPGAWYTGERYARNIIGDFNNHVEAFIEWNLILNEQGGPNHVKNFCDAPILADPKTDEFVINSSYIAIGHFSKFIEPGAKRIHHTANLPKGLSGVTYQNPHGEIVVVLLNESHEKTQVDLEIEHQIYPIFMDEHSLVSLIFTK
jgi:glucosylceramidase